MILGRPSDFCMFMMSYILREKVSSLIQTDMIVSESNELSLSFFSIVYCLPSTQASRRVVEQGLLEFERLEI